MVVVLVTVIMLTTISNTGRFGNRNNYYNNNKRLEPRRGGLSNPMARRGVVSVSKVDYRGYQGHIRQTVGGVSKTSTEMGLRGGRTIISLSEGVSSRALGGTIRSTNCGTISMGAQRMGGW